MDTLRKVFALALLYALPGLAAQAPAGGETRFDRAVFTTGTQNTGAILQDTDGFLWIGTNAGGLFRFDGYELRSYKPGGAGSISDVFVYSLYQDGGGTIWIGTGGGGLNRYDKETGAFRQYRHDPSDPRSISYDSFECFSTQTIREDRDGTLWVGTSMGLNAMDRATGAFTRYLHDPADPGSLSGNVVRAVLPDRNGVLWVGVKGGGLNRFDGKTGTFDRYRRDPAEPRSLGSDDVTALLEDRDGTLWIGTERGLFRLERDGSFTAFLHDASDPGSLAGNSVVSLYQDRAGTIWVAHSNAERVGLDAMDPRSGRITHHRHDPGNPASLGSDSIFSVLEDRAGTLWCVNDVGTVDRLDRRKPPFRTYRHDPDNPNGLPSPSVVPILEDRAGLIWIGTFPGGLTSYDGRTDTFTTHLREMYLPGIYEDSRGTFWLGSTVPGRLHVFDRESGRIERTYAHDPSDPGSLALNNQINAILEDRNDPDILWLATMGAGLERFDRRAGTFTHFKHDPGNPNSLSNNTLWNIRQDRDGILWIPTLGGGLDSLDPSTGRFRHHVHDPDDPHTPSSNTIHTVFEDASGTLWIGTAAGFDRFDRATGTFTRFTERTGYPMTSVMGIGQDRAGDLWLGSGGGDGIARFRPGTGALKTFREEDGLCGNVFYPNNALRDRDGQMWFGGVSGITRFLPAAVTDNPEVPPVVVTALKQGGESLPLGSAPERVRAITLDWQRNYFEFEYAALDYMQPQKNRYRYKLEGLDKDWFDAGTRRFGRYSGLRGGQYTLRILGSNNDGVWNREGASLRVTVVPPLWERWWVSALAAAAVLGIFLAFYGTKAGQVRAVRAAARALRESEERYRTLFHGTPVGVSVSTAEGRYVACNANWTRLTGRSGEAAGEGMIEALFRDPQDFSRLRDRLRHDGSVRSFQAVMKRPDGSAFDADLSVTPLSLDGRSVLLAVLDDVTERRRAEETRERLLEQIGQVIDAVPEGVFLVHADGSVLLANPAGERIMEALAGANAGTLAVLGGRPLAEILAPPPGGLWHEVILGGPPERTFEAAGRPIGAMAAPESRVLVVREVTREREMQSRARQQEKLAAVGQLTAGIAHDFNNLLTAINGFAELGRLQPPSQADIQEWTGNILEAGRRAADLVRQLLAFSRKQVVEPRALDLNGTVAAMEKMLRHVIGEAVSLTLRPADGLWTVRADPTQIEQVLLNLAINARDAMPQGGRLAIETANAVLDEEYAAGHMGARLGEHVLLSVSDTGTGMGGEVKAHLFEPFFTTKPPGRGTGLGLATVFGIVKQCGGSIGVYSEEGRGTVFRIYLPRCLEEPAPGPSREGGGRMPSGDRTILLAEDASGVRELARRVLEKQGYRVLAAADGQEALRLAAEHEAPIHLLLTDVIMPGIGGKDLAEKLARLRPGIRILFMSGYTDNVISYHGVLDSGVAFLPKPFGPMDLARRVKEVLEGA